MANDTQFVRGAQRLSTRIATIRRTLSLPPLTEEIGGLLLRRTLQRFRSEVNPDYAPWAPLAPSTLRRKGPGLQKLVRTDAMRKAIQLIRGRADGGTFTNTGAGMRIGITDPEIAEYATIQNNGNRFIRARRFLGVGRLDVRAVDNLLRRKALLLERRL